MRRALSLEASNVAAPRDFVYFDDALEAFDAARYHLALLHHKGCAEAGAVDERAVLEAVVSRGRVTKIHQMAAAGLATSWPSRATSSAAYACSRPFPSRARCPR